ncbi:MAG: type I-E CRISPR-associated protein Cas7/Cse4/CasC [Burkholderiales bacterium]|nr:type I-E CRISPR-associated protein Cas7/Cse4/CasC [Burkholderiales bacterium]
MKLACEILEKLIGVITKKSPGAKLGSTAPYAHADVLLLEVGSEQPRTLANAFLAAVPTKDAKGDVREVALQRMAEYLEKLDEMHGAPANGGRFLSTGSSILREASAKNIQYPKL